MAGDGTGKGETVRQERTSVPGDRGGLANPTRSKVEQGVDGPSNTPGRPHRGMTTDPASESSR